MSERPRGENFEDALSSDIQEPEEVPEVERGQKRTSLSDIFSSAQKKIVEGTLRLIEREDPDIKRVAEKYKLSGELSQQAGDFFQSLIPRSFHPPEKEYQYEQKNNEYEQISRNLMEELKAIRRRHSKEEYKAIKQLWLEEINAESTTSITEVETPRGLLQKLSLQVKQEGGPNIIREDVHNTIANFGDTKFNAPSSGLIVRDTTTGIELDLEHLLPNNYYFFPSVLRDARFRVDEENLKLIPVPTVVDLHQYDGTKGAISAREAKGLESAGRFYEMHEVEDPRGFQGVAYGDLTEKGGILKLLHEIAHAWQHAYHNEYGRQEFEKFYKEVVMDLHVLMEVKRKVDRGERDRDFYEDIAVPRQKEKLANWGVEIDTDRFIQNNEPLAEGEMALADDLSTKKFIIKTDVLKPLISDYTRQERDAWAHAIRVLRFLRKKGIDLEPELKKLQDFKEIINPALGSYQESLDNMVESSVKQARFSR
ncbi:MAG: hypothetical protein HY979_01185 [Candidatus Magasanikbacteria bacterium]|nr:hypothetical protein [Candidatus Magasanikbacteria bacterium]